MGAGPPLVAGKRVAEREHLPAVRLAVQEERLVETREEGFDVGQADKPPAASMDEFPLDIPDSVPAVQHLQKRQRARVDRELLAAQFIGVLEDDHPAALDAGHDHLDVRTEGWVFHGLYTRRHKGIRSTGRLQAADSVL